MKDADRDKSGTIDFVEFIEVMKFVRYRKGYLLSNISEMERFIEEAKAELEKQDQQRLREADEKLRQLQLSTVSSTVKGKPMTSKDQTAVSADKRAMLMK